MSLFDTEKTSYIYIYHIIILKENDEENPDADIDPIIQEY